MNGVYSEVLVVEQSENGKDFAARFEESRKQRPDGCVERQETTTSIVITWRMVFMMEEEKV